MEPSNHINQLPDIAPVPPNPSPQPVSLAAQFANSLALATLDDHACAWWLASLLHSEGPACPHCHNTALTADQLHRWHALRSIRCTACERKFSARTGTILHGANLTPTQIVLTALLLGLGHNNQTIAKLVGCSDETARLWRKRLI